MKFKAYNKVKEPLLKICLGSSKCINTKLKGDFVRGRMSNVFKQVKWIAGWYNLKSAIITAEEWGWLKRWGTVSNSL